MMNDCKEVEIREALPDLVHGALPAPRVALVQQHLDVCSDCAAELAIVRAVLASAAAPRVDATRIVASIPPYARKSSRTHFTRTTYLQLAAAVVIGAAGISTALFRSEHAPSPAAIPVSAMASSAIQTSGSGAPATATNSASAAGSESGLALVGTADVSDADLAQLIQDMNNISALPPTDPEPVIPAALEGGAS